MSICPVGNSFGGAIFGNITVFLGLVGLTCLEYGVSRKNYSGYIIVKNFLQFSLAIISYWLIGYAFSFGDPNSEFIGQLHFGGDLWLEENEKNHGWCFSYNALVGIFVVFIINNAVVEKVSYISYVVYPVFILVWVWPVIVSWSWGRAWLYSSMPHKQIDDGGSVTVFTFAGAFGLAGALMSGRRRKRFKSPERYRVASPDIYVIGCFLTILGVLGIGFSQTPGNGGIALANLWISGAISSVFALKLLTLYDKDVSDHYVAIYQGFIAGMVFIASSASNSRPWVVGLHALFSGPVFALGVKFVKWVKIDDPANVTATFLLPGIFGGILPGFIDDNEGVYYHGWDSGQTLGSCVVGTFVILFWSFFWALLVFGGLRILGLLKLGQKDGLENAIITQLGFSKGPTEPAEHQKVGNEA